MGIGLVIVGIAGFGFLAIVGNTMPPAQTVALQSLYMMVSIIGPGLFVSLEQETNRVVSSGLATGVDPRSGIRRIGLLGLALAGLTVVVLLAASPLLIDRLLGGNPMLLVLTLLSVAMSAAMFLTRGLLGASQQFTGYSASLAAEGLSRLIGCVVIVLLGLSTESLFGLAFVAGGGFAALVALPWLRREFSRYPRAGAAPTAPPADPEAEAGQHLASAAVAAGSPPPAVEPSTTESSASGAQAAGTRPQSGLTVGVPGAEVPADTAAEVTADLTREDQIPAPTASADEATHAGTSRQSVDHATAVAEVVAGHTVGRIAKGLVFLGVATLLAQLVANLAPLVVNGRLVEDRATATAFGFAFVLTRIPLLLFSPIQAMLLPVLTKAAVHGEYDVVRKRVGIILIAVGVVGLPGAVFSALVGPWLVVTFFGAQTLPSAGVMGLLGLSTVLLMLAQILQPALVAMGMHQTVSLAWVLGTLLLIGLLALPGDPITAAVIAQLAGPLVVVLLTGVGLARRLRSHHRPRPLPSE
ncbi:hypothetical protein UA75_00660 [Actinoalloteichus sp. GBA129-24]|uniref:Uncharacterized protein n=2 Tax=Pseudonocardiaceae TaxID=2070 RepID=A0AAC9PPV0_9PSEU|nr:hypothetical protein UA74_00660 [Actinoalloteichus fjordicus]APU18183.1 hypothetical protein UA75_00660 [Actinoalloteichus sp. GBA129-24]